MQVLGPFTVPALGGTDEQQLSGAGVTVGCEITNLSGNLLRIQIGGRNQWLPAFRVDRYPLTDEGTILITNQLVEIPNAPENVYLIVVAFTNDSPDGTYLNAFPGTYPNDIGRDVAVSAVANPSLRAAPAGQTVNATPGGVVLDLSVFGKMTTILRNPGPLRIQLGTNNATGANEIIATLQPEDVVVINIPMILNVFAPDGAQDLAVVTLEQA